MQSIIQQIDGWADMTAAEIRAALIAPDPQRRSEADATWTTKSLLAEFQPELIESLIAALKGSGFPATADALTATGLDFGNEKTQEKLDYLGQTAPDVFTPTAVADLKSLGVDPRSKWQRAYGDDPEPSEAEVVAAIAAMNATSYGETLAQRVGAAIRLAAAKTGATESTIRAAASVEIGQ